MLSKWHENDSENDVSCCEAELAFLRVTHRDRAIAGSSLDDGGVAAEDDWPRLIQQFGAHFFTVHQ